MKNAGNYPAFFRDSGIYDFLVSTSCRGSSLSGGSGGRTRGGRGGGGGSTLLAALRSFSGLVSTN
jgi:hypothetical protein